MTNRNVCKSLCMKGELMNLQLREGNRASSVQRPPHLGVGLTQSVLKTPVSSGPQTLLQ